MNISQTIDRLKELASVAENGYETEVVIPVVCVTAEHIITGESAAFQLSNRTRVYANAVYSIKKNILHYLCDKDNEEQIVEIW